jgi:hypothetical protein
VLSDYRNVLGNFVQSTTDLLVCVKNRLSYELKSCLTLRCYVGLLAYGYEARLFFGETSSSHGGEYEDDCLLGCCAVQSGRNLPKFQRFWCLHHQGDDALIALTMEAVSISETSVNLYQTTLRNIPEDSHLKVIPL